MGNAMPLDLGKIGFANLPRMPGWQYTSQTLLKLVSTASEAEACHFWLQPSGLRATSPAAAASPARADGRSMLERLPWECRLPILSALPSYVLYGKFARASRQCAEDSRSAELSRVVVVQLNARFHEGDLPTMLHRLVRHHGQLLGRPRTDRARGSTRRD